MLEDFINSLMYDTKVVKVHSKDGGWLDPIEPYKDDKYSLLHLFYKKRKEEIYKYYKNKINYDELNKKIKEYEELKEEDLKKLDELVELVRANLAIASTKEEVEEILKRYEILDKNGKMEV